MTAHALIIDDDPSNIEVLAELLSIEGVAYTGILDPRVLDTDIPQLGQVDVVFLDLEMPKIDGYQVFEYLRTLAEMRNVPIVAYTVHVNEINTVRQMGFNGFLAKPLDDDQFPDQLARILRGESVWKVI